MRRAFWIGTALAAFAGGLVAQLPVPDGPVNPGQLFSYDISAVIVSRFYQNCTINGACPEVGLAVKLAEGGVGAVT